MNDLFERGGDDVIDLSGTGIRKLEKCGSGHSQCLILDNNELTRLENIESYGDLKKLSVTGNKLVRMYGVCKVTNLKVLDLANNCIVAIEGLRELIHLKWLKLAGNKIKTIEHLNSNVSLEFLDLSSNSISCLVNLSHLKLLRTLLLAGNNIKDLNNAGIYLPDSIVTLGIANNLIGDLNQVVYSISFLSNLKNLEQLTITNNPCLLMTGNIVGFDYRPFIINWCQHLKLLDGFVIGSKESLKAEWLYSMGKGRHFQLGEHAELIDYLANVCPLTTADNLVTEEDAKLNLILSKWHQHQQQLLEEHESDRIRDQRPLTAPSFSDRDGNVTMRTTSKERLKHASSSRPLTSLEMNSQRHLIEMPPSISWRVDKQQANNDVIVDKYPVELEIGSLVPRIEDHDYEESEESFLLTSHKVPSDVPESSHDSDLDSEAPATVMALRSESQYVPVPETMLSPDFRPVSASPQCSLFDVGIGSDAQIMTSSLEIRPKWQQRSAIPRAAYSAPPSYSPRHLSDGRSNRCVRNSVTDSPLLKRPTQLQRVQKASRPVSLSPSCRRRSPSRIKKTNKSHEDGSSSSNDDSTDSDVSISKLALVKEAAQSKLDAIARKNLRTTEENQSNYSEKNQISEGKCLLELKADLDDAKSAKILTEQKKTTYSSTDIRRAATIIQSFWRGYRTRNYDQVSVEVRHEIRVRRAEDHVRVLRDQLAKTQIELDRERQLRTLQMEAIRALWNEVQQLQISHLHKKGIEHLTPDSGLERQISSRSRSDSEVVEKGNFSVQVHNMNNVPKQETMLHDAPDHMKAQSSTCLTLETVNDHVTTSSFINDAAAKKMISHLIHSCSELQNQVKQLQEALGISGPSLVPHDSEPRSNLVSDSAVHNLTHTSSPFVSAVGTPVTSENTTIPSTVGPSAVGGIILPSTASSETCIPYTGHEDPAAVLSAICQGEQENEILSSDNANKHL